MPLTAIPSLLVSATIPKAWGLHTNQRPSPNFFSTIYVCLQVNVKADTDFRLVLEGKASNGGFAIDHLVFSQGKCTSKFHAISINYVTKYLSIEGPSAPQQLHALINKPWISSKCCVL